MITGEQVLAVRKERKLARRAAVDLINQLNSESTWTSGRLGDLEKGKKTFEQFRPAERTALAAWLGVEVPQDLPAGDGVPDAVGTEEPSQPGGTVVYGPDDDPVIWPVVDDTPRVVEVLPDPVVATSPAQPYPGGDVATIVSQANLSDEAFKLARKATVDAYLSVHQRLGGKPAPPFGWPSSYRADDCPAADMPRILQWCQRVHEWLDEAEAGTGRFAPVAGEPPPAEAGAVVSVGVPQPPPATAPAPSGNGTVSPPTATVVEQATPTDQTTSAVSQQQAEQPVGVAALWTPEGYRKVSNSELQTFKHCRRRWWLGWYRGLRLAAEPSVGVMPLGTRIHNALAEWYVPDGQTPVDPRQAYEKIVERDELALVAATSNLDGDVVASRLTEFQKESDVGRAMIEGYVQWLAETGADAGYTVTAPEQVLTALLEVSSSLTIKLQGRLDVRLRRDTDLVKLFMDHKSVGNFSQPTQTLPLDEQMKTYLVLEEENRQDGEERVEGALYNMLRRVKRTAGANPPFYQRLELRHPPLTITNFRERLRGEALQVTHAERMLQEGIDHHVVVYPTPSAKCSWGCEFTALCSMLDDGSRAEDFITEHYVVVNPVDRYDKDDHGD